MQTNKLPQGWVECELKDLLDLQNGYAFSSKDYVKFSNTLNIRMSNIRPNGVFDENHNIKYLPDDYAEKYKDYILNNGDLIIAMTDMADNSKILGVPTVVMHSNDKQTFLMNQRVGRLISFSENVYIPFLKFILISPKVRDVYKRKGKGGLQLNLSKNDILSISIILPPLNEQKRIVEKIEEEFGKIDEGVEKLKLAQEQIKQYRQSILKSAFEGKLYKTTNWVEKQLKTISDVLGGYAFKSEYYTNNGFQIIRMGNIKPLKINYGEKPVYINNFDTKIIDKYSLQIDDIVITLTGTRKKRDYGYVAIINSNNLLLNQRLARLRFKKDCYPKYFLYALQSEPFQTKFFSYETGNVGQGNVSIKAITEEYIDVPTLNEQKQIVAEIEKRFEVADGAERVITENLEKAEQLKQSILKKAFEGRLVPQDPTDEPASVLLAKIKAERSKNV